MGCTQDPNRAAFLEGRANAMGLWVFHPGNLGFPQAVSSRVYVPCQVTRQTFLDQSELSSNHEVLTRPVEGGGFPQANNHFLFQDTCQKLNL